MKTKTKWMMTLLATAPLAVYAAVLTDDGLNTSSANTVANGESSVAIGSGNTVKKKSLAVGENNSAAATTTSAGNSLAVGTGNSVENNSIGVGTSNLVAHYITDSAAFGTGNTVGSSASLVAGSGNTAYGYPFPSNSMTLGRGNINYSSDSIVLGVENTVIGFSPAWVMGEGNIHTHTGGKTARTVILGTYNAPPVGTASLVIGNGTDNLNRSNGLEVHKNGDVIIPKTQGDISMGGFGN